MRVCRASWLLAATLNHAAEVTGPFLAMMAVPVTFICCGAFFGAGTAAQGTYLAIHGMCEQSYEGI